MPPSILYLAYKVYEFVEDEKQRFTNLEGEVFRDISEEEEKVKKQTENVYIAHSVEHFVYVMLYVTEKIFKIDLKKGAEVAIGKLLDNNSIKKLRWLYGFVLLPIKDATQKDRDEGKEERRIFIDPKSQERIKGKIDEKIADFERTYMKDLKSFFEEKF